MGLKETVVESVCVCVSVGELEGEKGPLVKHSDVNRGTLPCSSPAELYQIFY